MRIARRAAAAVVLALLIPATGVVRAQTEFDEVDWAEVKRRWDTLSPSERAKLWELERSGSR